VTNYLETLMSCALWQPTTSATMAREYRKLLDKWAEKTSSTPDFVQFQGHDFSMRGMGGLDAACTSGAGHLLSFSGTDTIPAIAYLENYYGANIEKEMVGCSVAATEHSVMCAGGAGDEFETYRRLIEDVYPTGIVSIVSDTWDLWQVLTDTIPKLRDSILTRDGKVVIRPDSGDPVDIICGTLPWVVATGDEAFAFDMRTPAQKGVVELLWETFGGTINDKGFKELDPHIGAIYGDAITIARADDICKRLAAKGFASTNIVFGIGSYTYQYNTRDTFGFALKSTHVVIDGTEHNIFKDPITDDGTKKSQTGRVVVFTDEAGNIVHADGYSREEEAQSAATNLLQPIFKNGEAMNIQSLAEIRSRI
jgi:nicotinamide phosphoribosyltransferase